MRNFGGPRCDICNQGYYRFPFCIGTLATSFRCLVRFVLLIIIALLLLILLLLLLLLLLIDYHTFASYFPVFSNDYHFACVWPTALKLGSIANFDMLFLVMGLISLVD